MSSRPGARATSRLGCWLIARVALALAAALLLGAGKATMAAADPPEPGPIATFHYTGGPQVFTVPDGVTYLTFDVVGGRGGYPNEGGDPGPGGETIAGLEVTPGQKFTIWVGENADHHHGWGYTCGGDGGEGTGYAIELAYHGGGGGGSSAVTEGAWTDGAGDCSASTRPPGMPLIVAGGGGGGGGREHIPLTNYAGGAGGAGGNPAQPGFPGKGNEPGPGGCVGCGDGNNGSRGVTETDNNTDTMGGGGGGGGGFTPDGKGGGGGGQLPEGNGAIFGGGGGAGGTSYAAPVAVQPIFSAGPLDDSGVVTVWALRQQGFGCTETVEHPSFPEGVEYAHVIAEGGAGGNRSAPSNATPGKGGFAGIASAELRGFAWEKINVIVGCAGTDGHGGGGYGFGKGGDKGIANSALGDDGAGGGGGSGVEIGEFPLVVAGGGGGGGGGAENVGVTISGGNGGNGGPRGASGTWGHDGGTDEGGTGGCAGAEFIHGGIVGGEGEGSSTGSGGGGGGGGGGGWGGACGGEGGNFPSGGGGGGGGGGSYTLEHSEAVSDPNFSTSEGVGTDGKVVFSFVVSTPTHVVVAGGSGQQAPIGDTFAKPLEAQVLDQNGRPLMEIPVTFTIPPPAPGAPSGHFAGGGTSATAVTDPDGIATSPPVVANEAVGSWQVRATAGAAVPADFSLANVPRPTATKLTSSANPAMVGTEITFTATVEATAGGPTPTGTVSFYSDEKSLGAPVPLSDGSAQLKTELPLGSHLIEAVYEPDERFQTSRAKLTEKVGKAVSTTTVTSSQNPSEFGEILTFTAHVKAVGDRIPTGTVQFALDLEDFGPPVPLSGGTATSEPIASLAPGPHVILALYSGDEFIDESGGRLIQSVGADATATSLTASANPSVFGQAVSFTATVSTHTGEVPTGEIRFLLDGAEACEESLSNGSATCSPPGPLAPGEHEVRAEYDGGTDFTPSHGAMTAIVTRAPTVTTIAADVSKPRVGQPVVFTAEVSVPPPGGGIPTGELQFTLDGEPLGPPVTITGAGRVSTPPITSLPVGVHAVGAEYSGDADHLGSAAVMIEEVLVGETTTAVSASANPTHFGIPVVFTAAVEPVAPAVGRPGGTVRFVLDGKAICDVPLDGAGEARCDAPTLYAGAHRLVAHYSGEADFEASSGKLTEEIVRVPSRTTLSSSLSPAQAGEAVTLTADVDGGLPGEAPTGTVSFRAGSQVLGSAPVHPTEPGEGRAYLRTSSLPPGSNEIVATYSGDDAIEPSSSPPFDQVIGERSGGGGPTCAPPNVRARLLVFRQRNEVRLVARNRGAAAAQVTMRFSDRQGRRVAQLGATTRVIAADGMVRVVKKLKPSQMKRLRRARGGFVAEVTIPAAHGTCASQSSRHLSVRRLVERQHVWFQRDSIRRDLPPNSR